MNYIAAVDRISRREIASVYLLYGEEAYLVRELLHLLINALLPAEEQETGLTMLEGNPAPQTLRERVETAPFFNTRNVIVVKGTSYFRAKQATAAGEDDGDGEVAESHDADHTEQLISLIYSVPEYSHLIFVAEGKTDKRKKIFKAVEKYGAVVEMEPLKPKEVRPWITAYLARMNKKIAAPAMEQLMAIVQVMPKISLGFLANELDKAALFTGTEEIISKDDLTVVLSQVPEVSVFVMLEALSQKQATKAIELLETQLNVGEPSFRLLALLTRQVRIMWQVKELSSEGYGAQEIANEMKIHPFVVEKLLRQSRSFTVKKLQVGLCRLAAIERDLKSGRADNRVLEEFIIEFCR